MKIGELEEVMSPGVCINSLLLLKKEASKLKKKKSSVSDSVAPKVA